MLAILLGILALAPAPSKCLTSDGKTACGYDCQVAHGKVACASTPDGICAADEKGVVCWDPPEWVRAHYGDNLRRPKCSSSNGKTVCGYHCQARNGEVQCAQSPDGICNMSYDAITCWDPAPSTYCMNTSSLPRPKCVVYQGRTQCGYGCEAINGVVRCANTPDGKCFSDHGGVICTDPPAPPMCGWVPCNQASADRGRSWCPPPTN